MVPDPLESILPMLLAEWAVLGIGLEGLGQGVGITGWNDFAGLVMFDQFHHAAHGGHNAGDAQAHGFDDGFGEAFVFQGGHDEYIAGAHELRGIHAESGQMDPLPDRAISRKLVDFGIPILADQ